MLGARKASQDSLGASGKASHSLSSKPLWICQGFCFSSPFLVSLTHHHSALRPSGKPHHILYAIHALHAPRSSLIPWTLILMAPSPAQLPPLPGVAQMSFPSFPWNSSSTHTSKVLCILLLLCGCSFTSLL